jgi:hypothetical protein
VAARPLRFLLALTALPLLQSCNAPGYATLMLVNHSGQAISFVSCRNQRFDLAPGETAELTSEYRAISPIKIWDCYARQPFTVRAGGGKTWAYRIWFAGLWGDDRQPLLDFVGSPRQGINDKTPGLAKTWIPVEVEPDGSLRAGRTRPGAESRPSRFEADFPDDVQPQGFPIKPQ